MSTAVLSITGFDDMQAELDAAQANYLKAMQLAFEYALRVLVNYTKRNAEYQDRTGNLRNSVSVVPNESLMKLIPASDEKIAPSNVIKSGWNGNRLEGIIFVGMEYAVYVEFMPGHWVLSGTFVKYKDEWLNIVGKAMREYLEQ